MVVCVPMTKEGQIGQGWGRAERVAVVDITAGQVESWEEFEVGWDRTHDSDGEGSHHARIATFLIAHHVQHVVASHMGPPMQQMLGRMGLTVRLGASGDARTAVISQVH